MKLHHSFVLAVCVIVASGGCRQATPDEHRQKAAAYVADQRYAEAIVEYRLALQIDPRRGDIRLRLGDAYMTVFLPAASAGLG